MGIVVKPFGNLSVHPLRGKDSKQRVRHDDAHGQEQEQRPLPNRGAEPTDSTNPKHHLFYKRQKSEGSKSESDPGSIVQQSRRKPKKIDKKVNGSAHMGLDRGHYAETCNQEDDDT
jgi:hypothetical protein